MKKYLSIIIVLTSSLGILIEMLMTGLEESIIDGILILKYFTIQSNLLVSIYFVLILLNLDQKVKNLLGGITVYIFVTFTIFHIMLSPIWDPEGIRALANYLLHYITPLLVVTYTIIRRNEYHFHYKNILIWMIYPFTYLGFLFLSGVLTGDYIYPFFDVAEEGIKSVFFMVVFLVVFFVFLSFILMKIVSLQKMKNID